MRILKLLLLLFILSSCVNKEIKQEEKQIINNTNEIYLEPKPTINTPQSPIKNNNLPQDFKKDSAVFVEEVDDFYNSELEYYSYITKEDIFNYTVTWNFNDGEEIYRCVVKYDKNTKESNCKCNISSGYYRWINGERNLIRYYNMPKEKDEIYPVSSLKKDNIFSRYYALGMYSDFDYKIVDNQFICDYYWYQYAGDKMFLVYECKTIDRHVVSYKYHHQEIWDTYNKTKENINIVKYDDYPRDVDYFSSYQIDYYKTVEERNTQEYKDMCNNSNVTDYLDLYEEYMEDFEDEDDAYVFYETYCE